MRTTRTVEECLARASRLMDLADEAADYETILTYDALAAEWVELAARVWRRQEAAGDR